MDNVVQLTIEGKKKLEDERKNLIEVERPKVIEEIAFARSQGDLSENADYDAARNKQAEIEGRIAEIEYILNNAKIIDGSKKAKTINVSSVVKYKELADNTEYTVKIVSSIESDPVTDPNNLKISNECSLGQVLIGKKVGDVVSVKAIKPYQIEILEVK